MKLINFIESVEQLEARMATPSLADQELVRRLVEVAEREGCRAALIDDETGIHPRWLVGTETVGVTAGASAPEVLVDRVLEALAGLGPVTVQERHVTTESVRFTLPVELRSQKG